MLRNQNENGQSKRSEVYKEQLRQKDAELVKKEN